LFDPGPFTLSVFFPLFLPVHTALKAEQNSHMEQKKKLRMILTLGQPLDPHIISQAQIR
jgi:hypothetical protein